MRNRPALPGTTNADFGKALVDQTAPLGNGQVRMAYLAVIGSHSERCRATAYGITETDVLRGLYQVYPERFNNKTNGIATRRWVHWRTNH